VAKRGTRAKPKFKRLCRRLGESPRAALGLLEIIWEIAATHARPGDIGRQWTDQDIADEIGWEGDAAALIDALVVERWLDPCPVHRLIVHDWHQHADGTVVRAMKRDAATRLGVAERLVEPEEIAWARPVQDIPDECRDDWRTWIATTSAPSPDTVRSLSGQRRPVRSDLVRSDLIVSEAEEEQEQPPSEVVAAEPATNPQGQVEVFRQTALERATSGRTRTDPEVWARMFHADAPPDVAVAFVLEVLPEIEGRADAEYANVEPTDRAWSGAVRSLLWRYWRNRGRFEAGDTKADAKARRLAENARGALAMQAERRERANAGGSAVARR
jgi:hypothetical protein